MAEEKLLTVREVSIILNISEKNVTDLVESGLLPAYKVGGVYLRFKRQQIDEFKKKSKPAEEHKHKKHHIGERVFDFFYFNDFYILAAIIILLLLAVIFQT